VSLISWIGTPLLLMMERAVWRPSWACQCPMPAFLVILPKRQLRALELYIEPSSWQKTKSVCCQLAPAVSLRLLCAAPYLPVSAMSVRE
jgi:hypothetical protein